MGLFLSGMEDGDGGSQFAQAHMKIEDRVHIDTRLVARDPIFFSRSESSEESNKNSKNLLFGILAFLFSSFCNPFLIFFIF